MTRSLNALIASRFCQSNDPFPRILMKVLASCCTALVVSVPLVTRATRYMPRPALAASSLCSVYANPRVAYTVTVSRYSNASPTRSHSRLSGGGYMPRMSSSRASASCLVHTRSSISYPTRGCRSSTNARLAILALSPHSRSRARWKRCSACMHTAFACAQSVHSLVHSLRSWLPHRSTPPHVPHFVSNPDVRVFIDESHHVSDDTHLDGD